MPDDIRFHAILEVFGRYGFRKTSMDDLAKAAGVSRQTIYNRFGSKEVVLDWAVAGYVEQAYEKAVAALSDSDAAPADALVEAFMRWTGDGVPLLHGPGHGAEILELGMDAIRRAEDDPDARFGQALAGFLLERGLCAGETRAADIAHLLQMASKGVLLKSSRIEDFETAMTRIVATVLDCRPA